MKPVFSFVAVALLVAGCSGSSSDNSLSGRDTLSSDPDAVLKQPEIAPGLLTRFVEDISLPIEADTSHALGYAPNDHNALMVEEVRYLHFGKVESGILADDQFAEQFYEFDSLRKAGFNSNDPSNDFGHDMEVYTAGKIQLNDSTALLLWIIDWSSHEGCGSGSTKILYASVLSHNAVTCCAAIGVEQSSGEPGYSSVEQSVLTLQADGGALLTIFSTVTEEDLETGESTITVEETYRCQLILENGTWSVFEVLADEMTFR